MTLTSISADSQHYTDARGYVSIKGAKGHPLADTYNRVGLHRVVLWEHLGQPEGSPCHWCGYLLPWKASSQRYCINVDHLDNDPSNNTATNLVAACRWCNANRTWGSSNEVLWRKIRALYATTHPEQRPNSAELLRLLVGELGAEAPARFIAAARKHLPAHPTPETES